MDSEDQRQCSFYEKLFVKKNRKMMTRDCDKPQLCLGVLRLLVRPPALLVKKAKSGGVDGGE